MGSAASRGDFLREAAHSRVILSSNRQNKAKWFELDLGVTRPEDGILTEGTKKA